MNVTHTFKRASIPGKKVTDLKIGERFSQNGVQYTRVDVLNICSFVYRLHANGYVDVTGGSTDPEDAPAVPVHDILIGSYCELMDGSPCVRVVSGYVNLKTAELVSDLDCAVYQLEKV